MGALRTTIWLNASYGHKLLTVRCNQPPDGMRPNEHAKISSVILSNFGKYGLMTFKCPRMVAILAVAQCLSLLTAISVAQEPNTPLPQTPAPTQPPVPKLAPPPTQIPQAPPRPKPDASRQTDAPTEFD